MRQGQVHPGEVDHNVQQARPQHGERGGQQPRAGAGRGRGQVRRGLGHQDAQRSVRRVRVRAGTLINLF